MLYVVCLCAVCGTSFNSMLYVACLCAAYGTNFDAPSVHVACKDKPK
jgi:hypothetical protein